MKLSLTNHPVHADQRQIEDDGVRIGYCGDKAGMPINLILYFRDYEVAEIQAFVESQIGAISVVCMVPKTIKLRRK